MTYFLRVLFILAFLSTSPSLCVAQGGAGDTEDHLIAKISSDSCSDYQERIALHTKNGALSRSELWETIPHVRTSFKWKSTCIRVPMQIVDVNRDSEYELLYLIDITSPEYEETKLYLVRDLSLDAAKSLIYQKYKSPFYQSVMDDLAADYIWDARKDIAEGAHQIILPEFFKKMRLEEPLRSTLINIDDAVLLLVEGIKSSKFWLFKFQDSKHLAPEPTCSFEKSFNYLNL